MNITRELRDYFDSLVDEVIADLPDDVRDLLQVVPIHVEDRPTQRVLREMEIETPEDLQGLYTHRPVPMIHLFRLGLLVVATDDDGTIDDDELYEQIGMTIMHEIGHHRGMNEDEVDELGYG